MKENRWSSRLTFILAASGSAIGLGNIWRFPFVSAQHGGGNFLLVYLVALVILGIPLLINEMTIGRAGSSSSVLSILDRLPKRFTFMSYLFVLIPLMLMSYYIVISGWGLFYFVNTLIGNLSYDPTNNGEYYTQALDGLFANPVALIISNFTILFLTAAINLQGLSRGLERANKWMIPLLFGMLAIMLARVLTLEGVNRGLKFYLTFDLSKLDSETVLAALTQVLFSLSLGGGAILVYGSYFDPKANIPLAALGVGLLDSLAGMISGLIIVPALFVFGYSVNAGSSLAFLTLPAIFSQLAFGAFFAAIFFFILILASLSSTISLIEVLTPAIMERFKIARRTAILSVTGTIAFLSIPISLGFNLWSDVRWGSMGLLDIVDYITSNLMFPIGVTLVCLYGGFALNKRMQDELSSEGSYTFRWTPALVFALRYPLPLLIIWITVRGLGLF